MTEYDRFVRAILEEPDDDTPRLVFADWLDDHGGPKGKARAELIRVQVEAARVEPAEHSCECDLGDHVARLVCPGYIADDTRTALDRRAARILNRWGSAWLPPAARRTSAVHPVTCHEGPPLGLVVMSTDGVDSAYFSFRRGWVEEVLIDLVTFERPERIAATVREVLAANPLCRLRVHVLNMVPDILLRVGRVEGGSVWFASLTADGQEVNGDVGFGPRCRNTRADLCRDLPAFLTDRLAGVEYRPVEIPF